jgi:excisionase family DNA binding protein
MEERLLTIQEVAQRLQHSVRTVREWLRTRRLRGVKTGREWRVREEDLAAFVQAHLSTAMRERED